MQRQKNGGYYGICGVVLSWNISFSFEIWKKKNTQYVPSLFCMGNRAEKAFEGDHIGLESCELRTIGAPCVCLRSTEIKGISIQTADITHSIKGKPRKPSTMLIWWPGQRSPEGLSQLLNQLVSLWGLNVTWDETRRELNWHAARGSAVKNVCWSCDLSV